MIHKAFLLLGSNRGNRLQMLSCAVAMIEENAGKVLSSSSLYETAPWGFKDKTHFLNQVLCIHTQLSPMDLLTTLLGIETTIGRKREGENYTSRLIDIDILFFDDYVIEQEQLVIPHPRLHKRRFALIPLAEVAADLIDPVSGLKVRELLQQCDDNSEVKIFIPDLVSTQSAVG